MQQLLTGKKRFKEFKGQKRKELKLGNLGKTYSGLSEKTKEDFEKDKLRLEIKELKKWWLFKPSYLSLSISFLFVLFMICWTYKSGILDIKYENLSLEKKILKLETISAKEEINKFNEDIKTLIIKCRGYLSEIQNLELTARYNKLIERDVSRDGIDLNLKEEFIKLNSEIIGIVNAKNKIIEPIIEKELPEFKTPKEVIKSENNYMYIIIFISILPAQIEFFGTGLFMIQPNRPPGKTRATPEAYLQTPFLLTLRTAVSICNRLPR